MTYDYRFDPDAPWPVVRGVISGPKGALSIRLVLDSGAHKTQLNRGTMIALGFREQDKTREAVSVGVGGARERGFEVIVPRFFVLGRKFAQTPVSVFEMPYLEGDRVDGLLGWDLIRQFHFELNGPVGVLRRFAKITYPIGSDTQLEIRRSWAFGVQVIMSSVLKVF